MAKSPNSSGKPGDKPNGANSRLASIGQLLLISLVLLAAALWVFPKTTLYDSEAGLAVRTFVASITGTEAPVDPEANKLKGAIREMQKAPQEWAKVEKDGATLMQDLRAANIKAVGISIASVLVSTNDDQRYFVVDPRGQYGTLLVNELKDKETAPFQVVALPNVRIGEAVDGNTLGKLHSFMGILFPVILIGALVFMHKGDLLGGSTKLVEKAPDVKFKDVIGAQEAKAAMVDVLNYLRNPKEFTRLGGRAPHGVLMLGGPGVGKTLLAKALAGEAGVNFIATSGSEFTSKWFGVGVQKVRSMFKQARKNAPCILFIDEADGIGKRVATGDNVAAGEQNRILNQVLVELDGFEGNEGVIVIAATNLAQNMDEALLREGRFDRRINVALPDLTDRVDLFRLYGQKVTLDPAGIDFEQLGRFTTGLSPATVEFIVANAATIATRKAKRFVQHEDFLEAIETARMGELNGAERALSEAERHRIAVHEAGHAIVSAALGCGIVEKVTILPRGGALGVTLITEREDRKLMLRSELENRIQMLLGGRAAELEVLGEASTGAAHDLQQASKLALDMVGRYGFANSGSLFSLEALPAQLAGSQVTAAVKEADKVLMAFDQSTRELVWGYRTALDALTAELLAQETVTGDRVRELMCLEDRKVA